MILHTVLLCTYVFLWWSTSPTKFCHSNISKSSKKLASAIVICVIKDPYAKHIIDIMQSVTIKHKNTNMRIHTDTQIRTFHTVTHYPDSNIEWHARTVHTYAQHTTRLESPIKLFVCLCMFMWRDLRARHFDGHRTEHAGAKVIKRNQNTQQTTLTLTIFNTVTPNISSFYDLFNWIFFNRI